MAYEPVLCYVDEPWAFFTTQELSKQWGEDWDDSPYEHNAEEPYEPCWHNETGHRNDPNAKRGWKPGTETPLDVGELCKCDSCVRDWNEDGTPKWEIVKVAYDGPFITPSSYCTNSNWSVKKINAGGIAWLIAEYHEPFVAIPAGTTLKEFIKLIESAGGKVYTKVE